MSHRPVSIIIPCYNQASTLRACLESLLDITRYPQWEVIVVDDGSDDGSEKYCARARNIRLIRQGRSGLAKAVNMGINAAGNNDIVRLHADVLIEDPDWLDRLATAAATLPRAGVVGAKLVYADDRIQSEGRNIITGLGLRERYANRHAFLPDQPNPGEAREVDSVSGALAYYRREALSAAGGFDENYWPMGTDDDDFCIAARFYGFKIYVEPHVKGVHYTPCWSPTDKISFLDTEEKIKKYFSLKKFITTKHYSYWREKWGWDPQYPDLNEIRRLYKDTEICWQIGEPLRFTWKEWPPTIDACLVTWNNYALLRRCLESLARTAYPKDRLKVFIVDNASRDETASYLQELAPTFPFPMEVIRLPVNSGVVTGLNWALLRGKGQLVARLDDDIILPPQWAAALKEVFRKRPFAGVVGPKILDDNAHHSIQCGPYRLFPKVYGHDGELNAGQADYLARATHVRGCCNLYRRDALERAGLFDLRFSPSQYDDPEHHIAMAAAGYEIIYDGTVEVVHKLTNGVAMTYAAQSNKEGNEHKLFGKWGQDIYEILDKTLDFSREGRSLPENGDTSKYLDRGPEPSRFPRLTSISWKEMEQRFCLDQLARRTKRIQEYDIGQVIDTYLTKAAIRRRDGYLREVPELLHTALNLAPGNPLTLEELSRAYDDLGQLERAAVLRQRAAVLVGKRSGTDKPAAQKPAGQDRPSSPKSSPGLLTPTYENIGEAAVGLQASTGAGLKNRSPLKVLMVNTYEGRSGGGDMHQLKKTKQYLERLGVQVDVDLTVRPDPRGYDLVHLWNTWFPYQTLLQAKAIRVLEPDIPIVLSPIYWDVTEKNWADLAVPKIFRESNNPATLDILLNHLANDELEIEGYKRSEYNQECFLGFKDYQKQIIGLMDYLLPQSYAEMRNLELLGCCGLPPYTIVRNAAEAAIFDKADPKWFIDKYRVKDFVLTVGLVEPRKNQLLLLFALRKTNLPVVVVGRYYDLDYRELCRRWAGEQTIFIDHLPHELLASAYKAARVHALPSWVECASFAHIEAALSGCALVTSDRTSEPEYFQDHAYYCDPADVNSIRQAVLQAYENYPGDAPKREFLQQLFRCHYTWEEAAIQTLRGYRQALARRGQDHRLAASCASLPQGLSSARLRIIIRVSRVQNIDSYLDQVKAEMPDVEIMVVDDGAGIAPPDGCHGFYQHTVALGLAKSFNRGACGAAATFIVFLDDSLLPHPGLFPVWADCAAEDQSVGLVLPALTNHRTRPAPRWSAFLIKTEALQAVHYLNEAAADHEIISDLRRRLLERQWKTRMIGEHSARVADSSSRWTYAAGREPQSRSESHVFG